MTDEQQRRDKFFEENKEGIKSAWEATQNLSVKLFDDINSFIGEQNGLTDNEKFLIISRALHQTYLQYCTISYTRNDI